MGQEQTHRTTIRNESPEPLKLEAMHAALERILLDHQAPEGEVSVLITDDAELQRLNRTYRGIDEATDVLTFPAPETAQGQIGDIAVSIDFARRQAEARGVPIHEEAAMLVIHGGLHLVGYNDETPEERAEMVKRMNEVANACGIATDDDWSSLTHGGGP